MTPLNPNYPWCYERPRGTDPDTGAWLVNNPERVDISGTQVFLVQEMEQHPTFMGKEFIIRCQKDIVHIMFKEPLTGTMQHDMDNIVEDHKDNWPPLTGTWPPGAE